MTVGDLLTTLEREGAELWEESGLLRFRAPKGVMTEERKQALREGRHAALEILRSRGAPPQLEPRPGERYDPFPLTDVQAAYVLGRSDAFAYGGVACHGYAEFEVPDVEPGRLEAAWRALIARHDMLRAVIDPSGSQQVLASVPDYGLEVVDLRDAGPDRAEAAIGALRDQMSHRVYEPGVWPMFDLRVSRSASRTLLHFSIDFLICDLVSTQVLLEELLALYEAPGRALPALEISFRDYRRAEEALLSTARAEEDRAWWLGRLDELPPPPELPVLQGEGGSPRFSRLQARLHADEWARLRRRAGDEGITPSVAVLAAFAEVIGRWSRRPRFTLDLTLQNRLPLHPQVGRLVGDFTAVGLLAVDQDLRAPLRDRARALQTRLWEDLDHRLFSGVRVAREIARRRGQGAGLFPVVFTSAIGAAAPGPGSPAGPAEGVGLGDVVYGITQTPQVWVDCQALESGGGLTVNWDVRDGVFPDGVVGDMFESFERLLGTMAGDEVWTSSEPVALPPAQRERRRRVNATAGPLPGAGLHEAVLRRCLTAPEGLAIVSRDRRLSYGELLARAAAVAEALAADGCEPGEIVAVVMEKGWEQVAAVLGILLARAAYLPVDSVQPAARRDAILSNAGARRVLTQSWLEGGPASPGETSSPPERSGGGKAANPPCSNPGVVEHSGGVDDDWRTGGTAGSAPDLRRIAVDAVAPADGWEEVRRTDPDALAYVIYTSGSTGVPKGVMITHRAALNTVEDINRRFGVGPEDRVLGLSNLGFDLSVYDIFGLLSVGGTLVLPDHGRRADPSHWSALAAEHRVSIWNSVPAQLQMLADYLSTAGRSAAGGAGVSSLRLALVSGDWIPVHLPDHVRDLVPGLEFVSLGGATEAAIWSIAYPVGDVPAGWRSIPYGKPLTNQSFHVLDTALRPCPDWVAGDLYIGGAGLALGYLGDRDKTEAAFIRHPAGGERLYRTGDLGRHLPDGNIEFLGREDRQVKIRGHRIELAEVESALVTHPAVSAGVVVVDGDRPLERRLAAFVETARLSDPQRWTAEATRRLAAAATAACAAVTSGVDRDRYAAYSRRVDEAALQSMLDALRQVGALDGSVPVPAEVAPEHRRLVRRWLRALSEAGLLEPDPSANGFGGSGQPVRRPHDVEALWADAASLAEGVEEPGLVDYFRANARRLPALLRAEEDPLGLLFPQGGGDVAAALYRDALLPRAANATLGAAVAEIARRAGRGRPLRVLEVGAGTGGATAEALAALEAEGGADYLFTDVSSFFLGEARRRFGDRPGLAFGLLDLDEDPRAQGISPNSFDLVLAADVLHATRDVDRSLARLHEALSPGGWLLVAEITRDHPAIMASLELLLHLDELGDFADERRGSDQTFLSPGQWRGALARAGAGTVLDLPVGDEIMQEGGMRVFAARVKEDRAPVDVADLVEHLAGRIPEYMIPASMQVVDALPLTSNGKVDHQTLRSWLAEEAPRATPRGPERPPDPLEARLEELWGEVFGVSADSVGLETGFLDLGGDSLLAARLAGRLQEEVPEAGALYFDELLRAILEGPTVAELAAILRAGGGAGAEGGAIPPVTITHVAEGAGPLWVLVHDGDGTLDSYHALIPALSARGTVAGLTVGDPDAYLALDPPGLVELAAASWAGELLAGGHPSVHLIGGGPGSVLALDVARRLREAGAAVSSVTLIGGVPLPGSDPLPVVHGPAAIAQHTLQAITAYDPPLYAGDVTLVWLSGDAPGTPVTREEVVASWERLCLGEVTVVDLPEGAGDQLLAALPAWLAENP